MSSELGGARVGRRGVLAGLGATAAGVGLAACGTTSASARPGPGYPDDLNGDGFGTDRIPRFGRHQPGITTPAPGHAIVAAFDVVSVARTDLVAMFKALDQEIDSLMRGGKVAARSDLFPPTDNFVVGPARPADGLSVTVSVGASLFDDRFGLASRRPATLRPMPSFPNDQLDLARSHGDVAVQICAHTPDACQHAFRQLMRATRRQAVLRWMQEGFIQPNTLGAGRSSSRNLLGFKDGTANPGTGDRELMDELVWVAAGARGEPAWAAGGTYHAIRLIQMHVEFWDRTPLRTQNELIGRDKASGAPLDGSRETDTPDFANDPQGNVFRLDGHIRRANPRTPATEKNRILRRGFNYSRGFSANGHLDQGLVFQAFQADLDRGFMAVQERLNGEGLEEYITPVGGGFFFALPGVRDHGDWLGRTLLT
ncbi:MAG TPA: iron uptake transporter deferrochelatase/peroxidase subunit [Acidimicrobiales bacterium]|jgi:deferrochelatase/peroxidase EfeB|nr:iron uptake transporter deferrochelatase/peroxidase subunit [Acidimicrobiales bacterium]